MMRFTEIGHQLRAFRLESGMRAEEIAAQLGVSRAALYRYEKGDVIKLETIQRLAELLKVSPLSLLGIGVEYYTRPIGFFERLRQLEDSADQILSLDDFPCYLTSSSQLDTMLADLATGHAAAMGGERGAAWRLAVEQVASVLALRRSRYLQRKPTVITMLSSDGTACFLKHGIAPAFDVPEQLRLASKVAARAEIEAVASTMEAEPIGLQFGVLTARSAVGAFHVIRARDRVAAAINPFRPDAEPVAPSGVAIVTTADEAVSAHQRVAEAQWRAALKGAAAAARLRELIEEHSPR